MDVSHKGNQIVTQKTEVGKRKKDTPPVRSRLLDSALVLFAKHGYDGVAVDEIVARAKANKRMVYHYFGSKEALYGEVLRTVYDELEDIETALFAAHDAAQDPLQAMEQTVSAYFLFLQAHPRFVRLLLWENLNEGRHLKKLERPVTKNPVLTHLTRILKAGEKSGRFREGLDPRNVFISLIGLCLVYFSNRYTLGSTLEVNLSSKTFLAEAAKHSIEILLHGISLAERGRHSIQGHAH
jgi:TetR/AcrR family transcriptional regulator